MNQVFNIKKKKTKKELKAFYALNRSTVGQGKRLGTVEHKCIKKYDRNRCRQELRRMVIG